MNRVKAWSRWLPVALSFTLLVTVSGCNQARTESIRHMNKGVERFQRGDIAKAVSHLEDAVKSDPTNDKAFYYMGLIQYQRMNVPEKGADNLKKAIKINGEDHQYHYHLGNLLSRQKSWVPAINAFEKALAKKPDHAESHYRLARALEMEGKFDRAQEAYGSAIRSRPRFPEAYNALGNLYVRFEKYPQAIQVFKNAIENVPRESINHNDLGLVYARQNRNAEAIQQFKKALEIKPSYASAVFNLGVAYANNGEDEQALKFLRAYLSRRSAADDPVRVGTAQAMATRLEAKVKGGAPQ
ncbi:MAG: tetratricopeptide repeat protein [Bradymonadia bacterium]